MSSLTSIFNFLYVYLRATICFIFGGLFDVRHFHNVEQISIARDIVITGSNGALENGLIFDGEPILALVVGIFAVGAIIGLVRRLIR